MGEGLHARNMKLGGKASGSHRLEWGLLLIGRGSQRPQW